MKATLKITHETGNEEFVDFEFTDEQVRVLRAYCKDAWKLRNSAIYGDKAANKFSLSWTEADGITFIGDPIDDEAWDAGMHRLRPLILSNEPASFYNVASLLAKQVKNGPIHARLRHLRKKFKGELMPAQLTWFDAGAPVSMEAIFDRWLNAFEHHRDHEKQDFFSRTKTLASQHQMRHFVNMHAAEKLRAIMGLFKLILDIGGDEFKPHGLHQLDLNRCFDGECGHRAKNA